jgi:broad specificity phosphatase PhoE
MTIRNIYLIRHGESLANVDKTVHFELPDHRIALSDLGKRQALAAGVALSNILEDHHGGMLRSRTKTALWVSPYDRTRQTADGVQAGLDAVATDQIVSRRENIALCEQHYGLFDGVEDDELAAKFPVEHAHYIKAVEHEGKFWAAMPMGESRFDVAMRVQTIFAQLKEEAREEEIENVVIVLHGVSMRAFIMQWRNHPYEWFENEKNPNNCDIYHLAPNAKDDGYVYRTPDSL